MCEFDIEVSFTGDFEDVYLEGDNSAILPSDSIYHHATLLANERGPVAPADFGEALLGRIMASMPAATLGIASLRSWSWKPQTAAPDSMTLVRQASTTATLVERESSGVTRFAASCEEFLIHPQGSSFAGFARDSATVQQEVTDRLLAGQLFAVWHYASKPDDCNQANETTRSSLIRTVSKRPSRSVQETLFRMGEAALGKVKELSEVELRFRAAPAVRCTPLAFGASEKHPTWSLTQNPIGTSRATISRTG